MDIATEELASEYLTTISRMEMTGIITKRDKVKLTTKIKSWAYDKHMEWEKQYRKGGNA